MCAPKCRVKSYSASMVLYFESCPRNRWYELLATSAGELPLCTGQAGGQVAELKVTTGFNMLAGEAPPKKLSASRLKRPGILKFENLNVSTRRKFSVIRKVAPKSALATTRRARDAPLPSPTCTPVRLTSSENASA